MNAVRFVDLFAGIGGLRLGLESSFAEFGIETECVFSCEINRKAQETYELNFGETPFSDITQVETLPEHDVLLAGFPCQAFSYAGKRQGFADTRGTLFFEIERLLARAKKKPKLLLLENVRGFISHDGGRTYATVISRLEKLGYLVSPLLLNSSNFGVPQNRVRIYLVCKLKSKPRLTIKSDVGASDSHKFKYRIQNRSLFNDSGQPIVVVGDVLESDVPAKYFCSQQFVKQLKRGLKGKALEELHGVRLIDSRGGNSIHSWDMGLKGVCNAYERDLMDALIANRRKKHFGTHQDGKRLSFQEMNTFWRRPGLKNALDSLVGKGYLRVEDGRYNPVAGNMSFEVFKFLDPESISITVVSSDANKLGIVQDGKPRRITPRECARLQGFPESYKLHPNDNWTYHQLGNSVSVPVISAIFRDLALNDRLVDSWRVKA